MNSNLSFKELINYLDLHNTDPMVRKLLEYISIKEENIIDGLVQAGMSPVDFQFDYDGYYYTPGQFIERLRSDLDYHERESAEWEGKFHSMREERNRFRARSVADILSDMSEQIRKAESERDQANRIITRVQEKNKELEDKINVWHTIEN